MEELATISPAVESAVRASLFNAFFSRLEQKEIPYAILSNYFSYPENVHSDVDFVVPERHRESIPSLVKAICIENDAHLLQLTEYYNPSAFSCLVGCFKDSSTIHLRFDVCSDDRLRHKLILPWQFMLEGRRRYRDSFFVPAPEKSLLYYLLKRIQKRSLADQRLRALRKWYDAAPEETEKLLRAYWPLHHGQILDCIFNQFTPPSEWLDAWSKNVYLRDAKQTLATRTRLYVKEMRRQARRVRQPSGFLVSFLGPDGCGKSTAIAGVKNGMLPAFSHSAEFHLLPRVTHRGRRDNDTSRPHAKKPRSALGSMAKTLLWFVDLSLGYWLKLRPELIRSRLIIFDRYVHDLQVDRTRYRYAGPQWWARLLANLSPQPDLWILLDAPAEILWQRKPELPIEESARQRNAYRQLVENRPNAAIVDASQLPENVVTAACSEIFRRLEARTAQRYARLLRSSSH